MAKAKIPISIDSDLLEKIRLITEDKKGGVSGWINEACKRKIRNEKRTKRRKASFKQRRPVVFTTTTTEEGNHADGN